MNSHPWNRREILRAGAFAVAGAPFLDRLWPGDHEVRSMDQSIPLAPGKPTRPLTAVVLGAGNRGNVYARYSEMFPDELTIVGVAEPIEFRRQRFSRRYRIPEDRQWTTWEHVLQVPKFADVLIITTPDHLHYGPAMGGLELGYDLLLEKAIAQSWKECNDILALTLQHDRIVAVCHVLRYTPYFRKLQEVVASGELGKVVSIEHVEPVEHIHMSHSFVRGNWRNSRESNLMLLSKSCHDLDILRWILGKSCRRVSSFGDLSWFRKENAPTGSTMRCTDGCAVESECPYSALRVYYRNRSFLGHFDLPDQGDQGPEILNAIRTGPYGRCVYHCDNDVVDHQIVAMEFEDNVTVAFSMEAFTSYAGRRTRVMGSMGDAVGDMETLTVYNFRTRKAVTWDSRKQTADLSGHGGGDFGLVHDFVRAVDRHDPSLLTSTIQASMESHLIAFRAEESRSTGRTMDVRME